jgi:hypothetical protein
VLPKKRKNVEVNFFLKKKTTTLMESDKKRQKTETSRDSDILLLDVGGTIFKTRTSTLCKYPETMLGAMFSGDMQPTKGQQADGSYFIDRSPDRFKYVLDFYRTGVLVSLTNEPEKSLWKADQEFFALESHNETELYSLAIDEKKVILNALMRDYRNTEDFREALRNNPNTFTWNYIANKPLRLQGSNVKVDVYDFIHQILVARQDRKNSKTANERYELFKTWFKEWDVRIDDIEEDTGSEWSKGEYPHWPASVTADKAYYGYADFGSCHFIILKNK